MPFRSATGSGGNDYDMAVVDPGVLRATELARQWARELLARLTTPEVRDFLAVGGVGYLTDVVAFNVFRSMPGLGSVDPSYARVLAVGVAMVVTYVGNRMLTWRDRASDSRHREVALFVVFNMIGLGVSVLMLVLSHDVLGLTSRLDDNISANVVGVALGTLFRFWSYRTFVFSEPSKAAPVPDVPDRVEVD